MTCTVALSVQERHTYKCVVISSNRVKPAIFDLLLAFCIAAYLGVMYLAIQVRLEPGCWLGTGGFKPLQLLMQ